jgi:hypothetical protein
MLKRIEPMDSFIYVLSDERRYRLGLTADLDSLLSKNPRANLVASAQVSFSPHQAPPDMSSSWFPFDQKRVNNLVIGVQNLNEKEFS